MQSNNKQIKAVIFDMDGVIVDSEPINSKSWEILLLRNGIKPILNKSGLIHEVGDTRKDAYQKIIDKHKLQGDVENIRNKRREIFAELMKKKTDTMPGLLTLIELLKKNDIKMAVASSRHLNHVLLILDNLKIKNNFQAIIGHIPTLKRKPEPDIYLYAAQKLKINHEECIALEDSEIGVISAKNAGMKVIAIPNKYTLHQDFSKADKIINNLSEISLEMLNKLL